MLQTAVFVDAGYLYAQGSATVTGTKKKRHEIRLDLPAALAGLRDLAGEVAPRTRLLRIYWYDGLTRGGRLSGEQSALSISRDVKLRLGMVNRHGEQKGVDSLIVTDMIELARNRAITDALILAGDEDIRVGVQVAQTFGVRVHLLGIEPSRGSQSPDLVQEADTTTEWSRDFMAKLLTIDMPDVALEVPAGVAVPASATDGQSTALVDLTEQIYQEVIATLPKEARAKIQAYLDANANSIPAEYDRPMLGKLKAMLGRDLSSAERAQHRATIITRLRNEIEAERSKARE
mgnify:CR=1 FL=1